MAVKLDVKDAGYLAYPAAINLKPALNNAGADQGYGWFSAAFVEVPWSPGSTTQSFLWGHDANKDGSWTQAGSDHFLTLGGPNTGSGMKSRLVTASSAGGSANGWPAGTRNWSGMAARARSAMGESRIYLVGCGLVNLGTPSVPDWHFFRFAWPQSGGSAAADTYIDATQLTNANAYVLASSLGLTQIFNAANSVAHHAIEWLGVFRANMPFTGTFAGGDYALDTSVLQDLMDGVKTYKTQTALRAWGGADATIIDLRPLINGDLTAVGDSTSAGKATALVPTGTNTAAINTNAGIIQPRWSSLRLRPVSAGAPAIGFLGGRGHVAPTVTVDAATGLGPLEFRVTDFSSGAAVPDFDWQDLSTSGDAVRTGVLPASPPIGGPYRRHVRVKADPTITASDGAPIYVGCVTGHWGQSQVEIGFNTGTPHVPSVADHCWAITLIDEGGATNQQALAGAAYTRPSGAMISINAADTPNYAGLVAAANKWTADHPDEPLLLVNLGLKTYGLNNLWAPEGAAWRGEGVTLPANMPGAAAGSGWHCWGNNLNLPGLAGGEQSGLITTYALILDRYIDAISLDMGTADATLSKPVSPAEYVNWGSGAYQSWGTNFASCADYLRGTFFTRSPNLQIIIHPFGRFNTSASEGWKLRDKQALRAMTGLNEVLGAPINDCQMDYGSVGSPHQRNGAGASPGVNNEVSDEGQQRRMRRIMASLNRAIDTSISVMGPRMTKWWRDPSDPAVAWIQTSWQAGLKTQTGAPYEAQDLPEFYFSADGAWSTVETSYHSVISPTGTFYARLDPAHPNLIKLTRKSGAAAWPATTGVACFEYLRSSIFDSGTGTKFQEKDGAITQASAVINVKTALDLLVYGVAPNDGDRGILLRQAFGTHVGAGGGLAQSAAPVAGAAKLVLTEKVASGTYTPTLVRKNAAGVVVDSQPITLVIHEPS